MNNMYLRLDIRVMRDVFLAFQYVCFLFFETNLKIISIKNLKTPNLKPFLGTIYPFEFVWACNKS